MNNKLSIEEFRKYKEQLQKIIDDFKNNYEVMKNNPSYNEAQEEAKSIAAYFKIEQDLFSHDLSAIPYEEYQNLSIMATDQEELDLSNSHANIDFSLIEVFGHCNFKGCNLKNIEKVNDRISPKYLDTDIFLKNKDLFLSSNFPEWFQEKWYYGDLSIEEVTKLDKTLIEELISNPQILYHLSNSHDVYIIRNLGLKKALSIYNYSKKEYQVLNNLIFNLSSANFNKIDQSLTDPEAIIKNIYQISVDDILAVDNEYFKRRLKPESYHRKFVEANENIFKTKSNLPEDVKNRYYEHNLSVNDVLNNYEEFKNIPLLGFMKSITSSSKDIICSINLAYGNMAFQQVYPLYPKLIKHLNDANISLSFNKNYDVKSGLRDAVTNCLECFKEKEVPDWANEMFTSIVPKYYDISNLKKYNPQICLYDPLQRKIVETNNIDNAIKFNDETHFFDYVDDRSPVNAFILYLKRSNIDFKEFATYQEFRAFMAEHLEQMREKNYFKDYDSYAFIPTYSKAFYQDFRHIFIDLNSNGTLQKAFYDNRLTPDYIRLYPKCFKDLEHEDLRYVISSDNKKFKEVFIPFYTSHFGNLALLDIFKKYAYNNYLVDSLDQIKLDEDMTKEQIDKKIRSITYSNILKYSQFYWKNLKSDPLFAKEYPELILSEDEIMTPSGIVQDDIIDKFYRGKLTFDDIFTCKPLALALQHKNINVAIRNNSTYRFGNGMNEAQIYLKQLGQEDFLKLCSTFGKFLDNSINRIKFSNDISYSELCKQLEELTVKKATYEGIPFNKINAPSFLVQQHPELFLDESAPWGLKMAFEDGIDFYSLAANYNETFPFLKDKAAVSFFIRKDKEHKSAIANYFNLFGNIDALKLAGKKPDVVTKMIHHDKVYNLRTWYLKTGGKFIPDPIVMENFPLDDIDKFLTAGFKWSNLMRLSEFTKNDETKEALLKIAYVFGTFDNDDRGYKKVYDLLTELPTKFKEDIGYIFDNLDNALDSNANFNVYFPNNDLATNLILTANSEKFPITRPNFFKQLYRHNADNTYTLTINQQKYPKTSLVIHEILSGFKEFHLINATNAHQLFGNFDFQYNPDFYNFFITNLDTILNDTENSRYLGSIQKQFKDIKTINSNRHLTWQMAVNYVLENKFTNVNLGNEQMAAVSSIAGYTQEQFEKLQEIYEYSKKRVKSSIPHIEERTDDYTYETLRLDDPLGLAIGTLTDCCQEIDDAAEVCMEHSMTSSDGRIFVIKDKENNIVAQSWVWRNQNVLCFDNIEIPHKAFERAIQKKINLTQVVYDIYKQAANILLEKDKEMYKSLLEKGKITKEEYDALCLSKVTVGLGYNDIAVELEKQATLDNGILTHPLDYDAPVKLNRSLYTNDSKTQYIIAGNQDNLNRSPMETKALYTDDFKIYDDTNFQEKDYLHLMKLELLTENGSDDLNYALTKSRKDESFLTILARCYNLDPKTTQVIYNSNMSIIYDIKDDTLRIGKILYNSNNYDVAYYQIKIAIEKIAQDKNIDLSLSDKNTQDLYNKINLNNDIKSRS